MKKALLGLALIFSITSLADCSVYVQDWRGDVAMKELLKLNNYEIVDSKEEANFILSINPFGVHEYKSDDYSKFTRVRWSAKLISSTDRDDVYDYVIAESNYNEGSERLGVRPSYATQNGVIMSAIARLKKCDL